jgi:uncharacterized membrane protein YfcA
MLFELAVLVVAFAAGAIASLSGFGIGSLLTPLLGYRLGIKLAVAVVSIPHFIATAVRFWRLRKELDRTVFFRFGLASAAGGLAGALLHAVTASVWLTVLLGGLLIFVGVSGLTGYSPRFRATGWATWIAGVTSGMFGGLVGNQGGIRSAALLAFGLPRRAFVATATAVGLIVDLARMPVYLFTQVEALRASWVLIVLATAGVVAGTLSGEALLRRISEPLFKKVVLVLILLLGVYLLGLAIWEIYSEQRAGS